MTHMPGESITEYWNRTGRWPFLVEHEATGATPASRDQEIENIRRALHDFEQRPGFDPEKLKMLRDTLASREAELEE